MKILRQEDSMDISVVNRLIEWVKNYLKKASAKGVVIGMSGGKDSYVTAGLCVRALGEDKVYGLIMPNGDMKDCAIAEDSCRSLGINYSIVNINDIYNLYIKETQKICPELSQVTTINIPPRIRMNMLYAVAGSKGYLVANTSNLSEKEVGYTTKWGDNVGDFAPLVNFTKSEVVEIGLLLGLKKEYVLKLPDDGLSGKTDEEKLGFSYQSLDNFIRNGEKNEDFDKIIKMHKQNLHKRKIESFDSGLKNYFDKEQ